MCFVFSSSIVLRFPFQADGEGLWLSGGHHVCYSVSLRLRTVCSMPVELQGRMLYTIGEALSKAGLSRSTYFRWVRLGRIHDTQFKDRNGRRVFTHEELEELGRVTQQLQDTQPQARFSFEEQQNG